MVLPINAINNAKLTWTRTSRKPHRPRGRHTSAKPLRVLVQDESSTNLTFRDVLFHPNNVVFWGDPMILSKFHEGFLPSQEILRVHTLPIWVANCFPAANFHDMPMDVVLNCFWVDQQKKTHLKTEAWRGWKFWLQKWLGWWFGRSNIAPGLRPPIGLPVMADVLAGKEKIEA